MTNILSEFTKDLEIPMQEQNVTVSFADYEQTLAFSGWKVRLVEFVYSLDMPLLRVF